MNYIKRKRAFQKLKSNPPEDGNPVYQKALEIAEEHFRRVNPSMWDGLGEQPVAFHNRRITYSVNRCTELDVSFEQDAAGWRHCCKLRDTLSDQLLAVRYGHGINSPRSLVYTILEICKSTHVD